MAVLNTEMKLYKAQENSDAGTNGGLLTSNLITSAVGNLFPAVTQSERTAGITRYRKAFAKVDNDADTALLNAELMVNKKTPGDDYIVMIAGTQTDTQSAISGDQYGMGTLDSDVSSSATTLDVLVEEGSEEMFKNGYTVFITDGTNSEYVTLTSVPSVASDVVTLTFTGDPLVNSYTVAGGTTIHAVLDAGTIQGSYSGFTVTSASGTYDDTTYPIAIDSIGAIAEDITITFDSATTFTVAGTVSGSLGSGNISTDLSPTNAAFGKPYWVLESDGFGGTWASSDTIDFSVTPAAFPIWLKEVVPAGASSLSANSTEVLFKGESA